MLGFASHRIKVSVPINIQLPPPQRGKICAESSPKKCRRKHSSCCDSPPRAKEDPSVSFSQESFPEEPFKKRKKSFKSFAACWLNPSAVIRVGLFHVKTHQDFFVSLSVSGRRMQSDILWVTHIGSGRGCLDSQPGIPF